MHKKKVSGKDYFYTTVRKGDRTESVYLGRDYNQAKKKELELKKEYENGSNIFLIDLIVIIAVLIAFAFLLKLPFTGYIVYDAGNVSLDINMFLSSNSYLMVDNVSVGIPFELAEYNGSLGYNVTTLVLDLDVGEHVISLIDNEEVVYNKVLLVGLLDEVKSNITEPDLPEANLTMPEKNLTLPAVNVTEENLTLIEENITVPLITKVYIKPNVNVKGRNNKQGRYNLVDKGNNKFDLDADVDGNYVKVKGLKTTKDIDIVFGRIAGHNSDFVNVDVEEIEEAEIELNKDIISEKGITRGTKPVMVCEGFDLNTMECTGILKSEFRAYEKNDTYIFNVTHFTAYFVGSSEDYTDISECLFWINDTADSCRLNDPSVIYNMSTNGRIWLSDADLYDKNNIYGGMVAGYNFSQVPSSTANDVSGLGYDGSISGSAVWGNRTFNINSSALDFDGLNDFINITGSDEDLLFNFSNLTFEAWIKPAQIKQQLIFDRKDDSFAISTRVIMLAGGNLRFITRTTTQNSCDTGATLTSDRWYHIATTYNGTTKEVYINGKSNKTCLHSGHLLSSDDGRAIIIGANSATSLAFFNGTMDEIAFYNRTLNDSEIKTHTWGHFDNYHTTGGGTTGTGVIEFAGDNQTLDCAGKTFTNIGNGYGIDLAFFGANNEEIGMPTVMNCNLNWFYNGINSDARNGTFKNITIKDSANDGINLGVGEVSGDYINYLEDVNVENSSTQGIQANANGLTNLTLINVNSSYSKNQNLLVGLDYYKIINSYFYNSTSEHCVQLGGSDVTESLFANNTIKYCYSDDKAGLGLVNVGSERLLVENNTIEENNINIITNTIDNVVIRNNSLGVSYELDYAGSGVGGNVVFLDKTANTTFVRNRVNNSGENAIAMGNLGAGALEYINISNNSFYNTSTGWDLYFATADIYNVSVWLNHFYRGGVNDANVITSRPNFSIYANGELEGNFYNESIASTSMGWNDIGPLNITTANLTFFYNNINNTINWTKQSSYKTITYLLEYNLTSDYASAGNTTGVSFDWIPTSKRNYLVRIKPYDGEYNGTVKYMSFIMDMINPDISFVAPTPGNDTAQAAAAIYVNTTSSDDYVNHSVILDWNRTLIAWWRMNNESGENDTYIKDWSFYENNGTAKNGTASACGVSRACPFYTQEGKIGGGFRFDSLGDYIQVADNDVFDINYDNFSIGFWFKTNNNAALQRMIVKSETNGYKGYRFDITAAGKVYFEVEGANPNYQSVQSINSINAGTWYHVVGVRKDDTTYLYLDGVLQGSDSAPSLGDMGSINDVFYIGSWFGTSGYFNGTIDEIQVYKRALSSIEINASFNASSYSYNSNFTNLLPDSYLFRAYAQDLSGNMNNTLMRDVRVDKAPYSNVTILPSTAYTNSILNATFYILDDDGDKMNVSFNWWNGSVLYLGKTYENKLTDTFLSFNLSDTPQHEDEIWNASIDIYDSYMNFTNSTIITILNSPPHIPVLSLPEANSTTTTRKPAFSWTGADNDTETIYYDVLVDDSSEFTSPITSYNQTATSFTPSSVLKADTVYYWKVRANDDTNVSDYSEVWNLTIASYISISMPVRSSDYGSKSIGDEDDTTDGTPAPMQLQNDGNVFLNATVYGAEALFNRIGLGNVNFRIKARNSSEVPSYDEIASQTSFINVPITAAVIVDMLNYTNATDLVNIDTEITVPLDEPDGDRGSNLIFTASLGDGNL